MVLLLLSTQASSATYQVTFTGTWNDSNVSSGYPPGAHFSPLVGATHNSAGAFWRPGNLASRGVENVAETGNVATLISELIQAQQNGSSGDIIQASGLNDLPKSTTVEFEVSQERPLVSLISMIAPSPDWFVGVYNIPLLESGR